MRYKITVSGTLDTWADEATVRSDFPMFVRDLESVHSGVEAGSVTLDSVEALPELEVQAHQEETVDLTPHVLAALKDITDRLERAGL